MSMSLTWWEDSKLKRTPDDFDEIETIRLKSVVEIPVLVLNRPKRCKLITVQHTSFRKLKNGMMTDFQRVIWPTRLKG